MSKSSIVQHVTFNFEFYKISSGHESQFSKKKNENFPNNSWTFNKVGHQTNQINSTIFIELEIIRVFSVFRLCNYNNCTVSELFGEKHCGIHAMLCNNFGCIGNRSLFHRHCLAKATIISLH